MISTVVKSTEPTGPELRISSECAMPDRHPGTCVINAREYLRAEVLAALDATANADVEHRRNAYEVANRAEAKLCEAESKLAAVTAERDAHAATIGRVRELAGRKIGPAAKELWAALDPKPAFLLPNKPGTEFWAMGPNEDYWTSFITFTDGTNVLYLEQETSVTIAFFPDELRERYNQFKPIEALQEVVPGVARLLDGAE